LEVEGLGFISDSECEEIDGLGFISDSDGEIVVLCKAQSVSKIISLKI